MTKRLIVLTFSAVIALSISGFSHHVGAIVKSEEVTTKDLGFENPGLLPTNPFYFLKEWRRLLVKAFTPDPIKKAELELVNLNERAAEIKKLSIINVDNTKAMSRALSKYEKNIDELRSRLNNLKETSENPNIDKLLDGLTDASFRHVELFDDLKTRFEDGSELEEYLDKVEDGVYGIIAEAPEHFDTPEKFKERLEGVIIRRSIDQNDSASILREVRFVGIINRMERNLPADSIEKIGEIKNDLTRKLKERMGKVSDDDREEIFDSKFLEQLPDDKRKIFEEINDDLNDDNGSSSEGGPRDERGGIDGIVCTEQYDPVCGENQKTYPNSCYAERAGVKIIHKGLCEGNRESKPESF